MICDEPCDAKLRFVEVCAVVADDFIERTIEDESVVPFDIIIHFIVPTIAPYRLRIERGIASDKYRRLVTMRFEVLGQSHQFVVGEGRSNRLRRMLN